MSYQPIQNNQIPEPPNQMVMVKTISGNKLKILSRFSANIKEKIIGYKLVIKV